MAMLAAPRRKQKVINLRAKNNDWSNDSNKFGQRMLEKMGWSSGKGLGAKENGIVEHVVARYKNDEKGLGFEDKNDQWTKHEDDFNALLANLSNAEGTEEKLHSGVSLEVKSKKSKARVHYHKFTRGKDLTRYSEKDLANIFGKKSFKEKDKQEVQQTEILEDVKTSEQVFTEKGSMEDYFKSKLANFKSRAMPLCTKNESDDNAEHAFKGFSNNAVERDENDADIHQGFGFSFYNNSTKNNIDNTENSNSGEISLSVDEPLKIKKKKKKNKDTDLTEDHNFTENIPQEDSKVNTVTEIDTFQEDESKSRKKSKKQNKLDQEYLEKVQVELLEEISPKKKKSKRQSNKLNTEIPLEPEDEVQGIEEECYVPKKKKKRKNKGSIE